MNMFPSVSEVSMQTEVASIVAWIMLFPPVRVWILVRAFVCSVDKQAKVTGQGK